MPQPKRAISSRELSERPRRGDRHYREEHLSGARDESPAAHVGSAIAYPWVPVAVRSELGEREYQRYAASLQARGLWPVKLLADINRIFLPVIWATLILLAMLSWREGDRIGTGLIAIITTAYVTNAAVCATFSGVYARYQARLSWLFLFAAFILLARLHVGGDLAYWAGNSNRRRK